MLLALFGGAIERLEGAATALREGRAFAALPLLAKAQLIVSQLAGGVNAEAGEVSVNLIRLYEFASHCIATQDPARLDDAARVLGNLKEGFDAIRDEAVELERKGEIPSIDVGHLVQLTA